MPARFVTLIAIRGRRGKREEESSSLRGEFCRRVADIVSGSTQREPEKKYYTLSVCVHFKGARIVLHDKLSVTRTR